MRTPFLKKQFVLPGNNISEYFRASLGDYYLNWTQRYLLYLLGTLLFGFWTFIGLELYRTLYIYTSVSPSAFSGIYAWHTALNFGFCHYLMDEWVSRVWQGKGDFNQRTVGKVWLIWFVGFILAFVIQRTIVYHAVELYYPKILLFYQKYPDARPAVFKMFFYCLPFWFGTVFPLTLIALRKQFTMDLEKSKLEEFLKRRQKEDLHGDNTDELKTGIPSEKIGHKAVTDLAPLSISIGNGIERIHPEHISHITVEDHYSRIFLKEQKGMRDLLVRMPLKKMIDQLPKEHFVQIHRSHVINLSHISSVERDNRSYRAILDRGNIVLPISRYRFPNILIHLREYLK